MSKSDYILPNLGIRGWEKLENPILALLFTGDAGLLLGSKGANKTNGLRTISRLVIQDNEEWAHSFQDYNCPSIEIEDLLGLFSPEALKRNAIEYINSPMCIWGKKFIVMDELNRANPALQGKYLQIIMSRKIMGQDTGVIWCWGAMNPLSYSGTNPLDPAMADRFAFMLRVPEFHELESENKKLAIGNHGTDSLFALGHFRPELKKEIRENDSYSEQKVRHAQEMFNDLKNEVLGTKGKNGLLHEVNSIYGDAIRIFLAEINTLMATQIKKNESLGSKKDNHYQLLPSGRRNSMMWRSIATLIAIEHAKKGQQLTTEELSAMVENAYLNSMTVAATGEEFDAASFKVSFPMAIKLLTTVGNIWDNRIETEKNRIKKLAMLLLHKTGSNTSIDVESSIEDILGFFTLDRINFASESNPLTFYTAKVIKFDDDESRNQIFNIYESFMAGLYCSPLISAKNNVITASLKARIADKADYSTKYIFALRSEDEWPFLSEKVESAYNAAVEKLVSLSEEHKDPFYKAAHIFFANLFRVVQANFKGATEENEAAVLKNIDYMLERILAVHKDIYAYIGPVVRKLLFDSFIPTGMTKEEHQEEIRLFDQRIRGIVEVSEPETPVSREKKLLEQLKVLNPNLVVTYREPSKQDSDELNSKDSSTTFEQSSLDNSAPFGQSPQDNYGAKGTFVLFGQSPQKIVDSEEVIIFKETETEIAEPDEDEDDFLDMDLDDLDPDKWFE